MRYANKVLSVDEAIAHVRSGSRLMLGEFVGAGEPACCIEALLASGIGQLTLITNTPGLRGGFLKARLFSSGQLAEFIGTHVGTTDESTQAYLTDSVHVAEFFPMGTWAEKVRAGALGLGGALVPVGVSILDQPGMFPKRGAPKQTLTVDGTTCFVEPPLRADVSIIKGWRADTFGNVEFRGFLTEMTESCLLACTRTCFGSGQRSMRLPESACRPDRRTRSPMQSAAPDCAR